MSRNRISIPLLLLLAAGAVFLAVGRQADRLTIAGAEYVRAEVRLNEFTASTQSRVALALDPEGGIVAVWDSRRQNEGAYGVFARWIDPQGRARGAEEAVNVERRSMQMRPAVAIDAAGNPFFAWQSFHQDGEMGAIIGRGPGDERILNATTAGDQADVSVAALADGRIAAAWTSTIGGGAASRIAVRVSDPIRGESSPEILLDAADGAQDRLPSVAPAGADRFVAVWSRAYEDGSPPELLARLFTADAEPVGGEILVDGSPLPAIEPSAAGLADGGFVVAWMETAEERGPDVRLRRFAADGSPDGPARAVAEPTSGWRSGVAAATGPDGRILIAWNEESEDGLASDLHARLLAPDGTPLSEIFRVNRFDDGIQGLAAASGARRIAIGRDGRMAFAWQGDSGMGDATAANVTVLLPRRAGPLGDVATGFRRIGDRLLALAADRTPNLDPAASPYVPPVFDDSMRGPLLDPEAIVRDGEDVGFTAFTHTGWTPPDPHMAAGIDHLMAIVNGGIAAFQKDGTLLWQQTISGGSGFWGPVGATSFVFDPEVIFDPYENRFIAMANERSNDNRSMFLLGIASTSDPTDPWHKYRFDVTALAGNDTDSPNIAVDRDAIYISADFFTPNQKYLIYIIDKSSVLDGGAAVVTSVLHTGTQSFGIPVMYTDDAPAMYMIEHFESDPSSTVRLWAVRDPLTSPNLVSTTLSVAPYYRPANLRSQGTTVRQYTFDARFWSCIYRDGSLWACHHMSLSNSPRVTVSRWYEFEMNGWPESGDLPTLRQQGTVAPPNEVFCSFNSIFANEHGDAVMVFARSSVNEYFSIARTLRYSGDPLGTMSAPEFIKQSTAVYAVDRWGDYSAVVADPVDSRIFWMHHEYTPGSNSWHTWIQSEHVFDPAALPDPDRPLASGLRATPSPTTGPATLRFSLAQEQEVLCSIFDASGRRIRQYEPGMLAAGEQQIRWDGRDASGRPAANGVYLVRLSSADGTPLGTQRIVVAR